MDRVAYFAYGTTQRGFAHHRRLAGLLGDPVARVRTVAPYAVVVPREAACSNPGCTYVHRMAALVPGFDPLRAEGDLFLVTPAAMEEIDRLESAAYVRADVEVVPVGGGSARTAQAYLIREPERWVSLVARGGGTPLAAYPPELASAERLKPCCERAPGHAPPHDVVDPLG